jgi:hypothetical protein
LLLILATPAFSQYYLRGEIKDEKTGHCLTQGFSFILPKAYYYSGELMAALVFTVQNLYDSLTVELDGYESKTLRVKSDLWQSIC